MLTTSVQMGLNMLDQIFLVWIHFSILFLSFPFGLCRTWRTCLFHAFPAPDCAGRNSDPCLLVLSFLFFILVSLFLHLDQPEPTLVFGWYEIWVLTCKIIFNLWQRSDAVNQNVVLFLQTLYIQNFNSWCTSYTWISSCPYWPSCKLGAEPCFEGGCLGFDL